MRRVPTGPASNEAISVNRSDRRNELRSAATVWKSQLRHLGDSSHPECVTAGPRPGSAGPAGDNVTMQFNGEGVNDGSFGTFPATGKRVSFPFVNVIEVNAKGEISRVEQLYDRLDMPTQLGHMSAG